MITPRITWKEIAEEYKKEIIALHSDISLAHAELSLKIPKSYSNGLYILEKTLELSEENIRLLKMTEPIEKREKQKEIEKVDDSFERFLDDGQF